MKSLYRLKTQDSRLKKTLFSLFSLVSCVLSLFLPLHSYGDIDKTLKNLEEKQKLIETWEADFIQTKESSLMTSKISSEGHIAFKKPNLINWRYTKGSNLVMIFNGSEAWLYYPNLKEAERYKNIERMFSKFPLALGLEVKDLRKYWDIALLPFSLEGVLVIELHPKKKEEKRIFDRMILWIEENNGVLKKVQIFESGGDNTIIEFKGIKLNEKFPPDIFIFKPPAGVKVSTPLD